MSEAVKISDRPRGMAQRGSTASRRISSPHKRREQEERLRAALVQLGRLNDEALERIAEVQKQTNTPFTRAASRLGLVTRDDVETAIGVQYGLIHEGEGEGRLPENLVIVRRPKSRQAEEFRRLRARLLTAKEADKKSLFAMASVGTAVAAVDHIALNLAASFAQLGKRTLIVDADLRAQRLAGRFHLSASPGLRDTLAGDCDIRDAVRSSIIKNLSVLPSGSPAADGHELLSGDTLRLTLEYLRCAFDVVIVMTAPFGRIADAQFIWTVSGAVFTVARRHHDRLPQLRELNSALRQVDASIIGAALAG